MSWYDEDFRKRAAISVRNTGGAATVDIVVTIPSDWDEFWDVIDNVGAEVRVTSADGLTLVTYDVDDGSPGGVLNKTTRAGRIEIDNVSTGSTANEVLLFWVYFDTASAQGSGATAFASAAPMTGFIDRGAPTWMAMALLPQRVGVARPRDIFAKGAGESCHIWCDITDALEQRRTPYAKRRIYEEPARLTITAVDETGAGAATVVDSAQCRFVEVMGKGGRGRRLWVRFGVTAGTTGTNYTVRVTVYTVSPTSGNPITRTLVISAGLRVETVIEPAT